MSRYERYYPRETEPATTGDVAFVGVNAKLGKELLQPGFCASAANKRFVAGAADDRAGSVTPVSHRWTASTGAHIIYGSGIFSDPDGVEWLLLATPGRIVQVRDGRTPRSVAIPEGLTGRVAIVQAFSIVLIFRGDTLPPWSWDGILGHEFQPIDQANGGDGTSPIPNGPTRARLAGGLAPVLLNNRLFVPSGRAEIAASDLLSYTRYDAAFADYSVNTGSDDAVTTLFPLTQRTLVVGKDQSICAIDGIAGDLSGAQLDIINASIGIAAGGSAAQVGGDLLFLSQPGGVYRLQQVIQDRLETASTPVSDAIEPIIRRINWRAASGAVAAVHGDYYFLAVPLDIAAGNNAVLPFNTVTNAWEGIHTFPAGVQIDALHITDHLGDKRLYAVDYLSGLVHLLYEGNADRVIETEYAIASRLETRGYGLGSPGQKRFRRGTVTISTVNPSVAISVQMDGIAETEAVAEINKSRTRSYLHSQPDHDLTNAGDDHDQARREDYSILLTDNLALHSGVNLGQAQSSSEQFGIRERGRFASLIITNTQGSCSIASVQIEGDEADRHSRTSA